MGINIDLNVGDIRHPTLSSDIGRKYRAENCHSDIGGVPISTSESIPISYIQKIFFTSAGFEPKTFVLKYEHLTSQPQCWFMNLWMPDIGYRIKVYSDVGLHSLQSDIESSDIKLSPISLIMDIRVSAHPCIYMWFNSLRSNFVLTKCNDKDLES